MPMSGSTALIIQHQIDAIKCLYNEEIERRMIATKYPSLSHHKVAIFSLVDALPPGLQAEALHRQVLKALKQPVPDRCYSTDELREALVAYHFRAVDPKRTIPSITEELGPSKTTLFRQHTLEMPPQRRFPCR